MSFDNFQKLLLLGRTAYPTAKINLLNFGTVSPKYNLKTFSFPENFVLHIRDYRNFLLLSNDNCSYIKTTDALYLIPKNSIRYGLSFEKKIHRQYLHEQKIPGSEIDSLEFIFK
jgi:hypothetical protein